MLPRAGESSVHAGSFRARAESLPDSPASSAVAWFAGWRSAGSGNGGRGWPLFRRLSRSVHGGTTGSERGGGGGSLLVCTDGAGTRIGTHVYYDRVGWCPGHMGSSNWPPYWPVCSAGGRAVSQLDLSDGIPSTSLITPRTTSTPLPISFHLSSIPSSGLLSFNSNLRCSPPLLSEVTSAQHNFSAPKLLLWLKLSERIQVSWCYSLSLIGI